MENHMEKQMEQPYGKTNIWEKKNSRYRHTIGLTVL